MKIKYYISILAIERLLEDETLPEDLRMQAEDVRAEIILLSSLERFAEENEE